MNPILHSFTICSLLLVTVMGSFNGLDLKEIHGWMITYNAPDGQSHIFHVTDSAPKDCQDAKEGEPLPAWVGEYWWDIRPGIFCVLDRYTGPQDDTVFTWQLTLPNVTKALNRNALPENCGEATWYTVEKQGENRKTDVDLTFRPYPCPNCQECVMPMPRAQRRHLAAAIRTATSPLLQVPWTILDLIVEFLPCEVCDQWDPVSSTAEQA